MILGHIDEWGEKAVDYLDGRLDSAEKAAVEQHLAECPACANRMSAQQGIIEFLRLSAEASPPDELRDRVFSEFPTEALISESSSRRKADNTSLRRRFRPWIPVTATVLVLFAGVVAYGLVHDSPSSTDRVASNLQGNASAQSTVFESASEKASAGDSQSAGAGDNGKNKQTTATTAIKDKKGMVTAMKTATQPVFVSFQAPSDNGGAAVTTTTAASTNSSAVTSQLQTSAANQTATTVMTAESITTPSLSSDQVKTLVAELGDLTGLEELSSDESVGGPTFAFFVKKDQLEPLLDLLYSIKSSNVDLALRTQPDTTWADKVGTILQRKAELPVLRAEDVPAPAVSKYSFTTSTLAPKNDAQALSKVKTPDSDGTHVLVIISIGN